jgi:hypothetical protein
VEVNWNFKCGNELDEDCVWNCGMVLGNGRIESGDFVWKW